MLVTLALAGTVLLLYGCAEASSTPQAFGAPQSGLGASPLTDGARSPMLHHTWLSPEAQYGKRLLYVLEQFGNGSTGPGVYIFEQGGQNQGPVGYLTLSNDPSTQLSGLSVDAAGTLYVGDMSNATVMEFPKGSSNPSKILTGADNPVNVIVGKDGSVYVANLGDSGAGSVMEYLKGSKTPSLTIPLNGIPNGLALDAKNDLYVAYNPYSFGQVLEFKPGSKSGTNLYLVNNRHGFEGIALGKALHLYVAVPGATAVYEYRLPKENVYRTIGVGTLDSPSALTLNAPDSRLWVSDNCCGGIFNVYGFSAAQGVLKDQLYLQGVDPSAISGLAAYPPDSSQ
jgi:hypothetical protein